MLWHFGSGLIQKFVARRQPVLRIAHDVKLSYFRSFSELWSCRFSATSGELNLLRRLCHKGAVLFDIGANVGYYSALMGRLCCECTVFSFEPSPETCEILEMNIRLNGLHNVHVAALAVADSDGWCEFLNLTKSAATNHLILNPSEALTGQKTTRVATTSLDSFTKRMGIDRIDFVKIDVEGAEVLLVQGASRLFRERRIRAGLIELCPGNLVMRGFSIEDLFREISSLGYVVRELRADGAAGRPYTPEDIPPDALRNAILLPESESAGY